MVSLLWKMSIELFDCTTLLAVAKSLDDRTIGSCGGRGQFGTRSTLFTTHAALA